MGLIITELKKRKPELAYFDESYDRRISGRSTIYHLASWKRSIRQPADTAKEHEDYRKEAAMHATYLLQNGHRGYRALWNHIVECFCYRS